MTGSQALAEHVAGTRTTTADPGGRTWEFRVRTHYLGGTVISVRGDEAIATMEEYERFPF